jgi:hypothetical protein
LIFTDWARLKTENAKAMLATERIDSFILLLIVTQGK